MLPVLSQSKADLTTCFQQDISALLDVVGGGERTHAQADPHAAVAGQAGSVRDEPDAVRPLGGRNADRGL
jgi:hypothetical protein